MTFSRGLRVQASCLPLLPWRVTLGVAVGVVVAVGAFFGRADSPGVAAAEPLTVAPAGSSAATNEACGKQATQRPHHMTWGLVPGRTSTYHMRYSVDALATACDGLGTRHNLYEIQIKRPGEVRFVGVSTFVFASNRAKVIDSPFRLQRDHWCKTRSPVRMHVETI